MLGPRFGSKVGRPVGIAERTASAVKVLNRSVAIEFGF